MAPPSATPGSLQPEKVKQLFGSIARRYDLINDVQSFGLHRLWKRRVISLAAPQKGMRALDLCCGTGDLALALSRAGASVTAVDFSEAMLAAAEQRFEKYSARTSEPAALPILLCADVLDLPIPDKSFDIVTIGYGLRNLQSWQAGLAEISRVCRPGARVIALEFGKPTSRPLRLLYFAYLKSFVPLLGLVFCNNPAAYSYILQSLKVYPDAAAVAEKMRALGFRNLSVTHFLGGAMTINYAERI